MSIDGEAMRIAREHPTAPGVAELIAASDAFSAALYPPESNHGIGLDELAGPAVRLFVARAGDAAIGCVAYKRQAGGFAEVKRLYVTERARGLQLGALLMAAIEASARADAVAVLRLETGIYNDAALTLYRRLGFAEIGPFPPYRDDPLSVFMQKVLV
ncbi:MAG: GNAT family N-acetyltransferase [Ancalomicrobiaceae bacterium]|nr:GNAT family N-acetyltransferase [Ancalomicrobiaceae bacterium]